MKLKKNQKLVNEFGDTVEFDPFLSPERPYRATFDGKIFWYENLGWAQAIIKGFRNVHPMTWTRVKND